ncbi:zinc-dependent metalloprotease [Solihabitans fulvus]|uniref:Zinc-dependent metalloprotease n=1 Tax=Solihabitans fulvus TaxID=1892852 RepID=A0A5B2XHU0_9PSEU|nr:zinc-dependent metalloprotease [Solihabitans fulvus]
MEGQAPVDWELAASTAARLVRPGPVVPRAEADLAVRRLRDLTVIAEGHVRDLTGLGAGLPLHPGEVVDRQGWVRAAVHGLAALTDGALPRPASGPLGGVLAGTAGVQAGVVLAFLSSRVLGQYDPFGDAGTGRLLLVAPNVVGAQRVMDVPAEDFCLWVCLHECTHRLQFTAVPWLRDYFAGQVAELLSTMDAGASGSVSRLPEVLRAARQRVRDSEGSGPVALVELLQSPEQRVLLDRLVALSTLLEGHADHVMDAVGPAVVPSVATIRNRFTARRKGGGLLDRVLRTVLGVEAKVRQYAEGSAFTGHVVGAVGMSGFNAVWDAPETLPTRAEISDPDAWLRRVHP